MGREGPAVGKMPWFGGVGGNTGAASCVEEREGDVVRHNDGARSRDTFDVEEPSWGSSILF